MFNKKGCFFLAGVPVVLLPCLGHRGLWLDLFQFQFGYQDVGLSWGSGAVPLIAVAGWSTGYVWVVLLWAWVITEPSLVQNQELDHCISIVGNRIAGDFQHLCSRKQVLVCESGFV